MAYFPNGTAGDIYMEQWCFRCVNWRFDEESETEGCIVNDLHVLFNYEQCKEDEKGKLIKRILESFIPSNEKGFPCKCRMFIEKEDADIPGQQKFDFAEEKKT